MADVMAGPPWSASRLVVVAFRSLLFRKAWVLLMSWLKLETTPSPRNFRALNCEVILSSLPMPFLARSRRLSAMTVFEKSPDLMNE